MKFKTKKRRATVSNYNEMRETARTISDELKERQESEPEVVNLEETVIEEPEELKMEVVEEPVEVTEELETEPEPVNVEDTPVEVEEPVMEDGTLTQDEKDLLVKAISENGTISWVLKRAKDNNEEIRVRVIGAGESITIDTFATGSKFKNLQPNKMYFPSDLNLYGK